jgi:hypothetical protein
MSIRVKSIDVYGIEFRLQRAEDHDSREIWNYVKSLKEALQRQQDLTNQAISKLKRYAEKYGNIE